MLEFWEFPAPTRTEISVRGRNTCLIAIDDRLLSRVIWRASSTRTIQSVLPQMGITDFAWAQTAQDVIELCASALEHQIRLVIVAAELGKGERHRQLGVLLGERLRRDHRLECPILFLSLDSRESLAARYSIVGENVVGSYFQKLPLRLSNLADELTAAQPIPDETALRCVIREHCHVNERLQEIYHDALNAFYASNDAKWDKSLWQLQSLSDVAQLEITQAIHEVVYTPTTDREALARGLAQLHSLISGSNGNVSKSKDRIEKYTSILAPPDWCSLLIVDDDGYSPVTMGALKAKGYAPRPVIETLEEALEQLEHDAPDVLLCDYRLQGEPAKGIQLARRGLNCGDVGLVVLISAEAIPADAVPPGAAVLWGMEKFDAERIHTLIVQASEAAQQ